MRFPAMVTSSSMLGLACMVLMIQVQAAPELSKLPLQTFYVPMREPEMFHNMFKKINNHVANPPIVSMVAMAISVSGTVIWYDHWEDGYDLYVEEYGSSTEIWGDGDASNGCSPDVKPCTDASDFFKSGDSVVIQNTVQIDDASYGKTFAYGGGDRIVASAPITLVRGGYPTNPGSLMAGSAEVIDTSMWGTEFEAPVGIDVGEYFAAFQFASFFFMAATDNTEVTMPDGSIIVLNQGETGSCAVKQGNKLSSSQPIQVHFITGDEMSYYELRWFQAWPTSAWFSSYVTPVGDTFGKTKMLLYNPNVDTITIDVTTLVNGTEVVKTETVKRGKATLTDVIPTGSGAIVKATGGQNFIAMSFTDTEYRAHDGQITQGQWYDWGFSVTPADLLTSQALVGWGYGCTDNNCYGNQPRSVVWVTPIADADIYIDFDNNGVNFAKHSRKKLTSSKFIDQDHDMSGAFLFATAPNSGPTGPGVPIAVAWGQDPSVSKSVQSISLDLGTVILPFPSLQAVKSADKYEVEFGQVLTYTIKIMSTGYQKIKAGEITVFDTLDPMASYVPNSASYIFRAKTSVTEVKIADQTGVNTPFPLDAKGFTIPVEIDSRGASLDIMFNVTVNGTLPSKEIVNNGHAQMKSVTVPFSVVTPVIYVPQIEIENTVYSGSDDGALCGTNTTLENVTDILGADVTYCFVVTNTGSTFLGSLTVVNGDLSYTDSSIDILAPGESAILYLPSTIAADLINNATVTASPLYADGSAIPDLSDVMDDDTSSVAPIEATPSIAITNTVYLGTDDGAQCSSAVEFVEGAEGAAIVYCFNVTNTGNTHLSDVKIDNADLEITGKEVGDLAPGESKMVFVISSIPSITLENNATATGNPTYVSGKDIDGLEDVVASDESSVGPLTASITIANTVYVGSDDGAKCATALEFVEGAEGTSVVYCFNVTNTGTTYLADVKIDNADLAITGKEVGDLAPGASKMVFVTSTVPAAPLQNLATAKGNPTDASGKDITDLEDVVASDDSSVGPLTASITIANTVYAGSDDGAQCSAALEFVEGATGTSVVYCFNVTNTGNTHLADVKIDNADLAITGKEVGDLAPGASKMVFVTSTIPAATLKNVATATGNPTDASGKDIDGLEDVVASDDSSVGHLTGSITIANTVYAGSDDGAQCSAGLEFVEGATGTSVVYCFNVTNTGNTHLSDVKIDNAELAFSGKEVGDLAPGASKMVFVTSTIPAATLKNVATASGNPTDASGKDIAGLEDVVASDDSSVGHLTASIAISNTVYVGSDDGAQCSAGLESAEGPTGTSVVYCFNVTNTGNTHLSDVKIDNADLAIAGKEVGDLAPGASKMVFVTSTVPAAALQNLATATGNPTDAGGKDIADLDDVVASDDSSAGPVMPSVTIANTVYAGSDDGAQCSAALELVEGATGTSIVYCFTVTNTGTTHLADVKIDNPALAITGKEVGDLAPGESKMVFVTGTIPSVALNNIATVTGNPTDENGNDIANTEDVVASDDSSVGPVIPSLTITNTVYEGSDEGAQCATASEYVEAADGTKVVYCFTVTNTGNTHLADVKIDNAELAITGMEVGDLAPGESKLVFVPGTVPFTALSNIAIATGKPSDAIGNELIGLDQVEASDDSAVGSLPASDPTDGDGDIRKGEREPYRPPNEPEPNTCLHDSYADGGNNPDDLVCTTEDVRIESMASIKQATCVLGEVITLDLDGSIFLSSSVYDLGWYVGTDAGDALEGSCAVNGLQEKNAYKVTSGPGSSTEIGSVSWADNSCGDVAFPDGQSGFIDTPITVGLPVVCSDENEDGELDISICFTWRTEDDKGDCTIAREDGDTVGTLADLYPARPASGTPPGCFCERYDIPNVSVEKPAVAPC